MFSPDHQAEATRLSPWGGATERKKLATGTSGMRGIETAVTQKGPEVGRGAAGSRGGGVAGQGGEEIPAPTLSAAQKSALLRRMILVSLASLAE